MHNFGTGIRILTTSQAKSVDLGPLTKLQGKWLNAPAPEGKISQGWNVIAVPGPHGFVLEVIPYTEVLTFTPVVTAGNRGPFINGNQVTQEITGLMYKQEIKSACTSKFCADRGFKKGTEIHAETGLFLNLGAPSTGFDIARLSTIPHGNSLLALGSSFVLDNPGNDFIQPASTIPTELNGGTIGNLGFGYIEPYRINQFPFFNQSDPNTFLTEALGNSKISTMTVLKMSTNNRDAGGGILNIPFIQQNVNATVMDATFWIESIAGNPVPQLQYTQTINLVFPPTGSAVPIVWPHVTINTMLLAE